MALTLNVDGKVIEQPGSTDIAHAFESLDKRPDGFLSGPGISMIILERDEAHLLMASGTHHQGFLLSYRDGEPAFEYNIDMEQGVSVDEVVEIFQAYARGDDWGQTKFKWETFESKHKTSDLIIKRLIIIGFISYFVYVVITKIFIPTK